MSPAPGRGSTFWFTVRVRRHIGQDLGEVDHQATPRRDDAPAPSEPRKSVSSAAVKVLLVDDNVMNQWTVGLHRDQPDAVEPTAPAHVERQARRRAQRQAEYLIRAYR